MHSEATGAARQHLSPEKVQSAESVVDRGDSQTLTGKLVSVMRNEVLWCQDVVFLGGYWPSSKLLTGAREFLDIPLGTEDIVMAEQAGHDVVNQTQSGGDASPSDVPASKLDNYAARGDGEGLSTIADSGQMRHQTSVGSREDKAESGHAFTDSPKMNGISLNPPVPGERSFSPNVGDASGGSDTDGSRAESRAEDGTTHSRTSSTKRPASFKPVSFAKFSISKSPVPSSATKQTGDKGKPT